uniref:Small ribosomal subunit protein uS9c n=1 Tax=Staurocarteria cerasiformis TaxID=69401 RepID=A0A0S2LQJ5_STACE|nr:ribosomal protein S9 [Carteria cerasiformis]ALO63465.1 ribosomal protein S9 [Carteria cerasiformis]
MIEKKTVLVKATGRRKEAVAQVIMKKGTGLFFINNKPAQVYLQNNSSCILAIKAPFETVQNYQNQMILSDSGNKKKIEHREISESSNNIKNLGGGNSGSLSGTNLRLMDNQAGLSSIAGTDAGTTFLPTLSNLNPNHYNELEESSQNNLKNTFFDASKIDTIVKVSGGGLIGQAEAIKLAVARAICSLNSGNQISLSSLNIKSNIDSTGNNISETGTLNEVNLNGGVTATKLKKSLKSQGLLTQDSRVKERRKYGLKKARKATQYHKR